MAVTNISIHVLSFILPFRLLKCNILESYVNKGRAASMVTQGSDIAVNMIFVVWYTHLAKKIHVETHVSQQELQTCGLFYLMD